MDRWMDGWMDACIHGWIDLIDRLIEINGSIVSGGQVYDGSKTGFDLTYLAEVTKVSANWQGFGDKAAVSNVVDSNMQAGRTRIT